MEDLRDLDIECLQLDVTKLENIRKVRDEIAGLTGGTLDILVNNAYALTTSDFISSSECFLVVQVRDLLIIHPVVLMSLLCDFFVLSGHSIPFIDANMDEVKTMFDINLFGAMTMVQEFIKLLIASGDGRIVNIGEQYITPRLFFCI